MNPQSYECVLCQQVHFEGDALYKVHLMRQSKHGIRRDIPPPVNPDKVSDKPADASPYRPLSVPASDSFILEISEATTLGQLQVVYACLGLEVRERFVDGVYRCVVYGQGAVGNGKGSTLAQAIRLAILDLRQHLGARFNLEKASGAVR